MRHKAVGVYAAAATLSAVAAFVLLELWKADLHVPFSYGGDALAYALVVKSTLDHGWWWFNPSLGAPGVLQLHDFPFAAHDTVHLLFIKVTSVFSRDWALLFNLYFLLGFPLITLSAMAVLRQLRVGYRPATVASVLYSFLPSRLLKGEAHLFLDVFYEVPLAILLLLWVCGDKPPLVREGKDGSWPRLDLSPPRSWGSLLVCGLLATTSFYYAAFAGFLLLAAGVWGSAARRSVCNALSGAALAGAILLGLAGGVLPAVAYHARHGPNPIAKRLASDADHYGLRIAQLLLPPDGHRLQVLSDLKGRYSAAFLGGEGGSTSLGLVGDAGFLMLLAVILSARRSERPEEDLMRRLAVLNVMAVLLGTVGGFGSLFAFLVHPQLRGYLRINVYIGFLALSAVAIVLDGLERRRPTLGRCALGAVLVLGLLDQCTLASVPSYAATKKEYTSDDALLRHVEATLPAGAMIFELPYVGFPEMPGREDMAGYDPIRPYLHSHTLRWAFPTMRHRPGDWWAQAVTGGEPSRLLPTVADVGFGGILIDREGYADKGFAIEAALRADLGVGPLASEDGRMAFFDITDYARRRHATMSREDLVYARAVAAHPLSLEWDDGCFGIEYDVAKRPFRWCGATGAFRIHNGAPFRRKVSIEVKLYAARPPAKLTFHGLLDDQVDLVGLIVLAREIDVPPGEHVVRFDCDGRPADAPADPRTLIWHMADLALKEPGVPARP